MNLRDTFLTGVDSSIAVITVDVFDTMLLRNWKPEVYRFWEVAARQEYVLRSLNDAPTRRELFASRLIWHPVAYRIASSYCYERDPRVEDIFQMISTDLRLSAQPDNRDALLRVEMDYELDNLEANAPLLTALTALKSQRPDLRYFYLSDMYLGASHIESLLKDKGAQKVFDGGYVSSDHRCTKSGGGLYQLFLEREKLSPAQVLHVGDNPTSDVSSPRRQGIRSVLLQRPKSLRVCRNLVEYGFRRWRSAQANHH